jgi:hypothetical protein
MYAIMLCVAASAVGIDAGWQRMPDGGGMEYIIQLDPQSLETLRSGEVIQSDVPPSAGDVRSYRIIVGTKQLPHETPPAPEPKAAEPKNPEQHAPTPAAPQTLAANPGGKPLGGSAASFEVLSDAAGNPSLKVPMEAPPEKPSKPWLPLTFTLFGLFASLGANVYLVWIAWDSRRQYLANHNPA